MCINTSSIVAVLWLAGCMNPAHSANSGTCTPLPQMLQFWPCFAVALTSHWMVCHAILIARLLPTPAPIPPVPGATPTPLLPKRLILPKIFPSCTSTTFCSSVLPVTQAAILLPNSILKCCCCPSYVPCTHLYTNFLCLLADPLGFEDPPPGLPVAAQTGSVSPCILYV
jgi:hypothetical protein